jgi:hypothetical protein
MANSMQLRPPCRQVYFASDGAVCKVHLQKCLFDVMPRGIESGLKREEGDWHSLLSPFFIRGAKPGDRQQVPVPMLPTCSANACPAPAHLS